MGTIAGGSEDARLGSVSFVDASGGLTIGTVNPTGIWATGDVFIATVTGDLTVAENINTSSTTATAIRLAAGIGSARGGDGTPSGGNILISGTPALTAGNGGKIALYTGNVAASTGLSNLAESYRYNTSITSLGVATNGYDTALVSNQITAIYRQQPAFAGVVTNTTVSYGDTLPSFSVGSTSGLVNGNAVGTIESLLPLYSGAGKLRVGSYGFTDPALKALGYDVSGITGTLTVTPKNLTLTGLVANNKTYDRSDAAVVSSFGTLSGVLNGDTVNFSATGASAAFANANVGQDKTVTVSGLQLVSAGDAANYSLASSTTKATISPVSLTVSGMVVVDKVYDGTTAASLVNGVLSGVLAGDAVTLNRSGVFASRNVGSGIAVSSTSTLGGAQGENYTLTQPTGLVGRITAKQVTLSPQSASKPYDGSTEYAPNSADLDFLSSLLSVSGDTVTSASLAFDNVNPGVRKRLQLSSARIEDGNQGKNYLVTLADNSSSQITGVNATVDAQEKAQSNAPQASSLAPILFPKNMPAPLVLTSSTSSSGSTSTPTTGSGANSSGVVIDLKEAAVNSAPVMAAVSLPKGTAIAGTGFSFELPESVRKLTGNDTSSVQASLPDGSALPAWLKLDARTLRFEAVSVPDGAFPLQVALSIGAQRVVVVISERTE